MSRIVTAVNAMIVNPGLITHVIAGEADEIFFLYKEKYKWSMARRQGGISLWFYPVERITIEELAAAEDADWEDIPMVHYRDIDIGTKEAKESFSELYTLLNEKVYGMDEVLDDISSDLPPF